MSRTMESDGNGHYLTSIISMEDCKYLVDDVCCNDQSDQCCDFPAEEYCKNRCPFFTKEDGIITG